MSEAITLLIQAALAVLGGTAAIGILIFHKKVQKEWSLIFSWILYVFFIFWIFNAARCLLLYHDRILTYAKDKNLLIADVLLTAGAAVFLSCTKDSQTRGREAVRAIPCAVLFLYYAVCFIRYTMRYANVNAAVYRLLLPGRTACLGLAVLAGWLFYEKVRQLWTGRRIGTAAKRGYGLEISVVSLVIVTFFLCPTFETVLTNMNELSFSLGSVWYRFILLGLLGWGAGAGVLLLLNEKKRKVFTLAAWVVSIGAYLQGMFLNGRLFLMDGKRMEWTAGLKIGNLLIWCVIGAALAGLCLRLKASGRKLIMTVSAALCLMQMIGVLSLLPSYKPDEGREKESCQNYLSAQGLYEVASEENVIIFVLDTFDVDYMDGILAWDSDFLEPLKGFIWFRDTVSRYSRTFPSIPYMLTEEDYFYEIPRSEYVNTAFSQCALWQQLEANGYQYYLFEAEEDIIGDSVLRGAANFVEQGTVIDRQISTAGCAEIMLRIGNYRLLPYFLKEYYIYTSGMLNHLAVEESVFDIPIYEEDDAQQYQGLRRNGLKVSEEGRALRFIHMNGAHAPYNMNKNGERVREDEGSLIQQCIGSMNFVYDYLECLQETGVYEQTTIIITADHGESYVSEQLEQNTNPILFIKPRGADADRELQLSDVYASQEDLLPTVCAQLGLRYDTGEGMNLLDTQGADKERVRYHYYSVVENTIQTKARTYKITGNSLDFKNWEATDEYHEFGQYYP